LAQKKKTSRREAKADTAQRLSVIVERRKTSFQVRNSRLKGGRGKGRTYTRRLAEEERVV